MTFPFKDVLGYQLQVFGVTNTLRVQLIIEHLAIACEECFVCWLVLPFRERNNFI